MKNSGLQEMTLRSMAMAAGGGGLGVAARREGEVARPALVVACTPHRNLHSDLARHWNLHFNHNGSQPAFNTKSPIVS